MVFLAGHIVAIVTHCATKLTATCSPMIGQFFDIMVFASTEKECFGKCWKQLRAASFCTADSFI